MRADFDYIVVGAGAAGSAMAFRLSQNPRNRVLLLEAGPTDRHVLHRVPKGFFRTVNDPRFTYRYSTEPVRQSGPSETWIRGKVLGGSTTINGATYMRGAAADFDRLATRGNPQWAWEHALAGYRAMEDHALGSSALRGTGGPLAVSVRQDVDRVSEALFSSAQGRGMRVVADLNETDDERIGFSPATISAGRRVSASRAFLVPSRRRTNLTIATRSPVSHVLFDGTRAAGVRVGGADGYRELSASRSVVLCAGTIETTLLLERSGIGDPARLHAAGITRVAESPNVGERVIEQHGVTLQFRLRDDFGSQRRFLGVVGQAISMAHYLATHRGPLATAGFDVTSQFKSSPALERPDIQGIWAPFALDFSQPGTHLARHGGMMFTGYQIRPASQSSIHLQSAQPGSLPVIRPRYFQTHAERRTVARVLRTAREICSAGPLADVIDAEEFPGTTVGTDSEILNFALNPGATVYHAVGSAAMGPKDDDVVDSQLRVRGVSGLRVADASVLPEQVSGNTAGPAMLVGWLGAQFILDDAD